MKDILSFPRKDAQTLDQAKIVAIDKNKGRVSLFMRNGLISTGTYLYDINDLKVGLSVLVGKINGSYVILNKIVSMPKVSNFLTMRSVISPIGENWNKIYGNDSHPQHFYYLGNDIIISSDIASKQWRSTDRGDTWSINTVTDYPNKENIVDLGNGVLIAIDAIHYHLIRSIDYGVTWDSVLDIPFEGEGVWYYSGDFCDLTNGNIVFYVTYSEAFFSSGYGSNRNLQALSRNYGAT